MNAAGGIPVKGSDPALLLDSLQNTNEQVCSCFDPFFKPLGPQERVVPTFKW